MIQISFLLAGLLAFAWLLVHLVAGGRQIVTPAFGTPGLDPIVRDTLYICWHFTSVSILMIAALFLAAAAGAGQTFALAGTALSAGFVASGVVVQAVVRQPFRHLPQGWLFLPIAMLGAWGLAS